MMTRKLWRSLMQPWRQHALYQRKLRAEQPGIGPLLRLLAGIFLASIILLIVISSPASPILNLFVLVVFAPFMVLALPLMLVLGSGLIYGSHWVWQISGLISLEMQQKRYDLLQLTGLGALGVDWAIGLACLHRHDTLATLHRIMRAGLRIVMLGLGLVLALISLIALNIDNPEQASQSFTRSLASLLPLAGIALLLYFDHIQATLIAMLLALLGPHMLRGIVDVRLWSSAMFLMLQAGSYGVVLILVLLLSLVLGRLGLNPIWQDTLLWWAAMLLAYALREACIRWLWRSLVNSSHSTEAETLALLKPAEA